MSQADKHCGVAYHDNVGKVCHVSTEIEGQAAVYELLTVVCEDKLCSMCSALDVCIECKQGNGFKDGLPLGRCVKCFTDNCVNCEADHLQCLKCLESRFLVNNG